jgi:hypothetical protein
MAEFNVKYTLYASDGTTPIYVFPFVQNDNAFQDPKDFVEVTGLRGVGSIIIPGSTQPWDLNISFIVSGVDYEDLISKLDSLQTTIALQTKYILKIDRTTSTTKDFNVMRLQSFNVVSDDFRTNFAQVECVFRVNAW